MDKSFLKDYILEDNPKIPMDVQCPRNADLSLDETVCESYVSSSNHVIVCNDGTMIIWGKRNQGKCRMYQKLQSVLSKHIV